MTLDIKRSEQTSFHLSWNLRSIVEDKKKKGNKDITRVTGENDTRILEDGNAVREVPLDRLMREGLP